MLLASQRGYIPFHFQAASYELPNGRHVTSGVPVGWPDLMLIRNDKTIFVELKVGKNKPSPEQLHYLKTLPNAYLVYSVNEFLKII